MAGGSAEGERLCRAAGEQGPGSRDEGWGETEAGSPALRMSGAFCIGEPRPWPKGGLLQWFCGRRPRAWTGWDRARGIGR